MDKITVSLRHIYGRIHNKVIFVIAARFFTHSSPPPPLHNFATDKLGGLQSEEAALDLMKYSMLHPTLG